MRAALLVASVLCGCDGALPDTGLDLRLRIPGAQLVRAPVPGDQGGPAVTFLEVQDPAALVGESDQPLRGRAAGETFALRIGLAGEAAYWVVPVGLEDVAVEGELAWETRLDFAPSLDPGETRVRVQAVDGAERGGPVSEARFALSDPTPTGALVVALAWDAQADVDLYVTTPDGARIGADDLTASGGRHDFDSNANCLIDGRRREHVVWTTDPPVGAYRVAVDLAATCGQPRVAWRVAVTLAGGVVAEAGGVLTAEDARRTVGGGATPLEALRFDVP